MCTAISYVGSSHFFGRNLDLEYGYREQVVITPRHYPFHFRCGYLLPHHYAMIGMATVANGEPLYYEATNERGLSIAGLNFPESAVYHPKTADKDNIAPFELIPWILGQCDCVAQVKKLLQRMHVWALPYSREFPLSPLHWMISDKDSSIVVEPRADGLKVYDNPVGVLTNEPPFPYHMHRLKDFMQLSPAQAKNRFPGFELKPYSNGMGALGMPGDWSSQSRFVKTAFLRMNSVCSDTEDDCISQFFHILDSVAHPRGCVAMENDAKEMQYEITIYSSCCNTDTGIYYYKTYNNNQISAVHMKKENLDGTQLISYPLLSSQQICWQN